MTTVLLHSCCAPCSAAILEWLQDNNYATTIFFYNPNIFPQEEYLRRKEEIVRYAAQIGVPIVDYDDSDWDAEHACWREGPVSYTHLDVYKRQEILWAIHTLVTNL